MSEIVFNPQSAQPSSEEDLQSQIQNLQTTLASLNQQVIILQEALQERDQQIAELKARSTSQVGFDSWEVKKDETLTIVGALINLYNYIFLPGKA